MEHWELDALIAEQESWLDDPVKRRAIRFWWGDAGVAAQRRHVFWLKTRRIVRKLTFRW